MNNAMHLHFSPGFLRLHNRTAIMMAIMSKTMDATTIVTMIIRLEVPPYFNNPTPKKRNLDFIYIE